MLIVLYAVAKKRENEGLGEAATAKAKLQQNLMNLFCGLWCMFYILCSGVFVIGLFSRLHSYQSSKSSVLILTIIQKPQFAIVRNINISFQNRSYFIRTSQFTNINIV